MIRRVTGGGPRPVHIRIEPELLRRIDHLCADFDLFRTDAIEMLIEAAMDAIDDEEWDAVALVEEFLAEEEESDN